MAKRRRKYNSEFKAQVVLEVLSGVKSGAEVCREYGIRSQLLSKWKACFLEDAASIFDDQNSGADEDKARIAELERLAGRQALEIEVLEKSLQHLALSSQRKREVAVELAESYPVRVVCEALEFSRSSFYYRPVKQEDDALRAALLEEAGAWPSYGYRRLTEELRRKGWLVNNKRIRRLMREMGLQIKTRAQKQRTTDSRHDLGRYPNLIRKLDITRPDQVWAADITYIRLRREFVYLAVIMDVFTRAVRGWHLARRLDHQLTLTALEKALGQGKPEIHHSDQGIQYAALPYANRLRAVGAKISMADVGQPTQNPHVERLIRTIKEEEVDLSEYEDARDAYRQIGSFMEDVYTYKRIHSCLGYLTPMEYGLQWQSIQTEREGAVI